MTEADCFAAGTLIATPYGQVPVEQVGVGDLVRLARGGAAAVIWHGIREVDCAAHPRPHDIAPVRIGAGAFAPEVPLHDLVLSPDHAVLWDDVLIPVRLLVNGRTVWREPAGVVTYHHLELATHDVILAEGVAAESYLDTGNRAQFAGTAPPDFAAGRGGDGHGDGGCAPWITGGGAVAAVRARVLARAAALGHGLTDDPALGFRLGGRVVAARVDGQRYTMRVPPRGTTVQLVSRSAVPAQVFAANGDHRRLGVAIGNISLAGVAIALDDPRLAAGWHGVENGAWRWTDGDAALRLASGGNLTVELLFGTRYWDVPV